MPQPACCSRGLAQARRTRIPDSSAARATARRRLDLPTPAGPSTTATRPEPARTSCRCRPNAASSLSRCNRPRPMAQSRSPTAHVSTVAGNLVVSTTIHQPPPVVTMAATAIPRRGPAMEDTVTTVQASTAEATPYALGRTAQEYERLRRQAQLWEGATERILDRVEPAARSTLPRRRVRSRRDDAPAGPTGGTARTRRRHRRGRDAGRARPRSAPARTGITSAPSSRTTWSRVVPSRKARSTWSTPGCCSSIFPRRVEVLARLWDAVAPGGYLVIQDYDMSRGGSGPTPAQCRPGGRGCCCAPSRPPVARSASGRCSPACSSRPVSACRTGPTSPDGWNGSRTLRVMLEAVLRSLLPLAVSREIVTEPEAETLLAQLRHDADDRPRAPAPVAVADGRLETQAMTRARRRAGAVALRLPRPGPGRDQQRGELAAPTGAALAAGSRDARLRQRPSRPVDRLAADDGALREPPTTRSRSGSTRPAAAASRRTATRPRPSTR